MREVPLEQVAELVGTEVGHSDWFTVDQGRISAFADATLDHQWIHVDERRAEEGPFGSTVAHGYLTLSLLPHLASDSNVGPAGALMALNYGSDRVRFLNPVKAGSRIRTRSTLKDFTSKGGGRYLATTGIVVEIEGDETPAMVADVLTMFVMDSR
ncbi:MAG: MaoC family dehydratase [Acidimicrobiia bacterium]